MRRAMSARSSILPLSLVGGLLFATFSVGCAARSVAPNGAAEGGRRTSAPIARSFARGRTFHVAVTGSDRADGGPFTPLRTLGAAVKRVRAGDSVIIGPGTYAERVDFARSGTASEPITFAAREGATVVLSHGFRVSGDHNVIRGLVVSPGETDPKVLEREKSQVDFEWGSCGQVLVTGSGNVLERISAHDEGHRTPAYIPSLNLYDGSDNTVRDIDFHDVPTVAFGAQGAGRGVGNTISGGEIARTRGLLVAMTADRATLEDVHLHDPGQTEKGPDDGNAADGININGAHVTVRRCRIDNVFAMIPTQHSDAIQWWNTADGLVLEGNVIGSSARGGDLGLADQGHIEWQSDTPGKTSQGVIIRNNLFLGTDGSYVINGSPTQTLSGQADDWRIVGNTFAGPQPVRGDLFERSRGWLIADNVFAASTVFSDPNHAATIDHNCYDGCDPGPGEGPHSFRADGVLPRISPVAVGARGVWAPIVDRRLRGAGVACRELVRDFNGVLRPDPPSIGAFEPRRTP